MFLPATLLLLAAIPDTHAGRIPKKTISIPAGVSVSVDGRIVAGTDEAGGSVVVTISDSSASETLELVQSGAGIHGSAAIDELPLADATLTVTLYDASSTALTSFIGLLGADGSVDLSACGREGCVDAGDLDALAGAVYPGADGGYDLAFDFSGADAYEVAYADVEITDGKTTTTTEIDLDAVRASWEGWSSLDLAGVLDIDTTVYDSAGKQLERANITLAAPWEDLADGVTALSAGDGQGVVIKGATHCMKGFAGVDCSGELVVVSTGWTSTTAPTHATVELDGGDTVTLPVNSVQVAGASAIGLSGSPEKEVFQVTIDGTPVKQTFTVADRGVCANGTCVTLTSTDGAWTLGATAYSTTASTLPTSVKVSLVPTLKLAAVDEPSSTLTYGADVTAVFASEVGLAADPDAVGLSGNVRVLAAADKHGKQKTLSKGSFYGIWGREADGDLALAGAAKKSVESWGELLDVGESIAFELTDTNKDGVITPPVVCAHGDGKGTATSIATWCP